MLACSFFVTSCIHYIRALKFLQPPPCSPPAAACSLHPRCKVTCTLTAAPLVFNNMRITLWKSAFDFSEPESLTLAPNELESMLSAHISTPVKNSVKTFSPYKLTSNATGRNDASVQYVSGLVFDVDTFPKDFTSDQKLASISACRAALSTDDIAQYWYTSHSHDPATGDHRWRLVIPLRSSIEPESFKPTRLAILNKYQIPADPKTSQSVSHSYFLPSRDPSRPCSVWFDYQGRHALIPPTVFPDAPKRALDFDAVEFPPEPTGPVDLTPLREAIARRISTLTRAETVASFKDQITGKLLIQRQSSQRKEYLQNLLDGKPLAPDGSRRNAMRSVTWELIWILPHDTSVGTIVHLLEPCIEAMRRQGSKVDEHETERLVRSAMLKAGAERIQRQKAWESLLNQFCPKDVRASLEGKS